MGRNLDFVGAKLVNKSETRGVLPLSSPHTSVKFYGIKPQRSEFKGCKKPDAAG